MDTRDFEKEFMQGTEEAPPASAVAAPVAEPEPPAPATLRDFEAEFMGQTPRSQRPVGTAGTQAPSRDKPASDQAKPSMRMTRTMSARRPPTTPERDLTLGEALTQAKSNLLPSIGGVFSSFKEAVTHPLETAEGVAALGKGALSKTAGAIGLQQDQAKAAEDQKVLNAILDQYKQTYGSEQGFLRALAKDPAAIMADLSMIMSGGATGVAKLAGTGSTAAKIASKVAAVAPNLDPIQASINLAKGASRATGATRRLVSSGLTGVPVSSLELVQKIGEAGTPEQRRAHEFDGRGLARHFFEDGRQRLRMDLVHSARRIRHQQGDGTAGECVLRQRWRGTGGQNQQQRSTAGRANQTQSIHWDTSTWV